MSEPFLILHKVRGEPAFDIAEKMDCPKCVAWYNSDSRYDFSCDECNDERCFWIIPTSGHRAHPAWHKSLEDIGVALLPDGNWCWGFDDFGTCKGLIPFLPDGLPDHYPSRATPTINLQSVIAALASTEPVERRD